MKKVFVANDNLEAQMLVHALMKKGIQAEVRGEFDPFQKPTVWVTDDETFEQATAIIEEIEKPPDSIRQPSISSFHKTFKPGFWWGLVLGVGLGAAGFWAAGKEDIFNRKTSSEAWDSNGDGKMDTWQKNNPEGSFVVIYDSNFDGKEDDWEYYNKESRLSESICDTDYDGQPDYWIFYDAQGLAERGEGDDNYDGKIDRWSYYRKGCHVEDRLDNDGDGRLDEWVIYKDGKLIEKRWSYLNDSIIDKKAKYKNGRKYQEQYDRNRDRTFEETVLLDEFERVVAKKTQKGKVSADH